VDRSEDMRIFAKVVESGSFAGAAARLNIAASKLRHPVSSPPPLGARHRMRPAETEDIVYQGSRIAVPPSAHGRGGAQTARARMRSRSPSTRVRPFDARAKTVLATGLIALSRRGAREDSLRWSRNAAFLGRR